MGNEQTLLKTINYKGIEYALVFNLNTMEQIQDEYGTMDKWVDLTENAEEPNIKALKFGLTAMINEGIDIYNEDHEDKREFLSDKTVGRIVTNIGLSEITSKVQAVVIESSKSDEKNS